MRTHARVCALGGRVRVRARLTPRRFLRLRARSAAADADADDVGPFAPDLEFVLARAAALSDQQREQQLQRGGGDKTASNGGGGGGGASGGDGAIRLDHVTAALDALPGGAGGGRGGGGGGEQLTREQLEETMNKMLVRCFIFIFVLFPFSASPALHTKNKQTHAPSSLPPLSPTPKQTTTQGPGADQGAAPQDSPLERFCHDLTADARRGRLDPLVGRDEELRRVVHILLRRTKNNPVLVGEPGE
jgi:hypothetical protein